MKHYYIFYIIIISLNLLYLSLLYFIKSRNLLHTRQATITLTSYFFVLHLWGMGVAIADQFQQENIVVYYFSMFVFSLILNVTTFEFSMLLISVQIIFVLLITHFKTSIPIDFDIISASFQYVFLSIFLRYYLSRLTDRDYMRRIKMEKLNEELTYLSYKDSLSGLYNRRRWEQLYQEHYESAFHSRTSLAVILLDIDYFKEYNDYYGHIKGDDVIRTVSKAVQDVADCYGANAGRYGGDELVISISLTQPEHLDLITSSIKLSIKNLAIPHATSKCSNFLSVSIGSHYAVPQTNNGKWEFLTVADKDLYKQKGLRQKRMI